MPELPEIETVLRGLGPVLKNQTIVEVIATRPDLRYPLPTDLKTQVEGQKVINLTRRSKYLLVHLENKKTVIIHLGMSGRIKTLKDEEPFVKHDHLILKLSNGYEIRYHDPRRFGFIDLTETDKLELYKSIISLGPEPFSDDFNREYLFERAIKSKTPVKNFLLDQRIVAGLGNIYVCEALYRAKINPKLPAHKLTRFQVEKLIPIIRNVLEEAIKAGGSTLRDHHQPNGEMGYFQHTFKVYGREGKICDICASLIERIIQSGRSTFYCPGCQR